MHPESGPEREPRLARRSPFVPEAKLCPRCLSPMNNTTGDLLGIVPAEYTCPKCGYRGPVFFVNDADEAHGKDGTGSS